MLSRLILCNLFSSYLLEFDLADDLKTGDVVIRRTTLAKAKTLSEIINRIVNEQEYITMRVISEDEERSYLESLSEREAVFIAEAGGKIIGMQSIDSPYKWSDKMEHVGMMGTLELKDYRRQGFGKKIAEKTLSFAKLSTYEKIVTFVLADNASALRFFKSLGFKRVGIWKKQAELWRQYKDEIMMELSL